MDELITCLTLCRWPANDCVLNLLCFMCVCVYLVARLVMFEAEEVLPREEEDCVTPVVDPISRGDLAGI